MTPGQQAAIVASAQDWARAHTLGTNQHTGKEEGGSATLPTLSTVADRAAQSGASVRTQKMADKVAKANPELAKEVARGETTLPAAVARDRNRGKVQYPTGTALLAVPDQNRRLRCTSGTARALRFLAGPIGRPCVHATRSHQPPPAP